MKDTRGSWTAIAAVGLLLIAVLGCAASRLSARRLTGRADPPPARDEAAIEEFELDRDSAEFAAARASWQRGDAERCHHRLARLLARNPQHEEAQLFAADVLLASGRPKDAASHLHRLIAIRPDNAKAQFALGRLLQDHGQPALAASYYQRAVELDPGNSEYLACRENASQAAESAEVAPSEQPPRGVTRTLVRSPAAAQTIAHATGDRGERAPEAATFAEPVETTRRPVDQASVQFPAPSAEAAPPESRTHLPEPVVTQIRLGIEALSSGAEQAAFDHFRRAADSQPDDPRVPVAAASAVLQLDRPDLAVQVLRPVADRFRDSLALHQTLAAAYYRGGYYESARETLDYVLDLNPASALSNYLMGCVLLRMGDRQAADSYLEQARRLDPQYRMP